MGEAGEAPDRAQQNRTSVPAQATAGSPRVFVSHASEDKERFVLAFAGALRSAGVDAWVDRWEMLPGDSLVKKIFTEGLSEADAVIVVLSRASIEKRWVSEELDAAVVKRINEDSKLIPIVLDDLDPLTEVPPSIRHLLLEYVPDPEVRDQVVERVLRSLFGEVDRPPLGPPPLFAEAAAVRIPGLDRIDTLLLRHIGSVAISEFSSDLVTAEVIASASDAFGVSEAELVESLELLDADGYIELRRTMGAGIAGMRSFSITTYGLEIFLRAYEQDYPRFEQTVLARLAESSDAVGTERALAGSVDVPPMIVRHLLDLLASNGDLALSKPIGPPQSWSFYNVSPRIRRRASR